MSKCLARCFVALAALMIIAGNSSAQMSSEFWINVKDDVSTYDNWTLFFGNHINATYGIDSLNPKLIERICPPLPPGFLALWLNIPGRVNNWGPGLLKYDFRGIPTNPNKVDTLKIYFGNAIYPTSDFTLSWPKADYFSRRCDSMFFVYPGNQFPRINAFTTDSVVIIDAGDRGISFFLIYKYGCKIIDAVQPEFSFVPTDFSLHQNYPNPFNPTTTIEYQLPFTSRVIIKVYNLLGQIISTLTDEIQSAGFKSTTWNANGVSSGVYFYRLEAVSVSDPSKSFTQVKKMVLER